VETQLQETKGGASELAQLGEFLEIEVESYERSVKTGARVTETELVEQALKAFLHK